jgi:hypothetical protein
MDNDRYVLGKLTKSYLFMYALVGLRSFLKVELGVLPLGQAALSIGASEREGPDFD